MGNFEISFRVRRGFVAGALVRGPSESSGERFCNLFMSDSVSMPDILIQRQGCGRCKGSI